MLLSGIGILSLAIAAGIWLGCGGLETWQQVWILPAGFLGSYLVLAGIAFFFLWICCKRVDLDTPQEHDSKFFRHLSRVYIQAVISILRMRVTVTGREKLPKDGRFLLVCNHQCDLDPVVLLNEFSDAQLAFISKRENRDMFIIGPIMHRIMCQMINRENDREALKTILKCIQLVKADEVSVAVFPEGYTSRDCKLHHFRPGVFKIAAKAEVPIVICTLQHTRQMLTNIRKLKPTDVQLHLVEVIPAAELKGKTAVEISDRVYESMIRDLGADYLPAEEAD